VETIRKAVLLAGKETFIGWRRDKIQLLAAAIAFYTLFSLAPLMVVVTAAAGIVLSQQTLETRILEQVQDYAGERSAEAVRTVIERTGRPSSSLLAGAAGLILLLLGATRVFDHLQTAFNAIWKVKPGPGFGLLFFLRKRLRSFLVVLGAGAFLIASPLVSAFVSAVTSVFHGLLPGTGLLWQGVDFLAGLLVLSVVFTVLYRTLPAVRVTWGDVWIAGVLAAFLFALGRHLLGFYLGFGSTASAYGAASSLLVILFWVYYSAQVLLLSGRLMPDGANESRWSAASGIRTSWKGSGRWGARPPASPPRGRPAPFLHGLPSHARVIPPRSVGRTPRARGCCNRTGRGACRRPAS